MHYLGKHELSPRMVESLKNLAQLNEVKNLKEGFYSKVLIVSDDNGTKKPFRFHRHNSNLTIVMFPLNDRVSWYVVSKERVGFYDRELQENLTIPRALFLEACKREEANFNLSNEQKELLMLGKEISIDISSKQPLLNSKDKSLVNVLHYKKGFSESKNLKLKNFVADFTFFLGKTTHLLKESYSKKMGLNLNRAKD